jgi:hypothetical protein
MYGTLFIMLILFVALTITLFVISRYLIKDIFNAIIYHHIILFHYLQFTVVHRIYLFGLTQRATLNSMRTLKN